MEWLTNEVEKRTWELFDKVEEMGGAVKVIENGYYLEEFSRAVIQDQCRIEDGEKIVVGMNKFVMEKEPTKPPLTSFNKEAYERSLQRLRQVKLERDKENVRQALDRLRDACRKREGITELLREKERDDVLVIAGGIIQEEDISELNELGVAGIFGPGTPTQ